MTNGNTEHVHGEQPQGGGHPHGDDHRHHGHEHDQGIRGALRYLHWFPQMWRSAINTAVVGLVDPKPGERVVDIGAGMGAGAMRAAAAGAHVIAVEPTPFVRRVLRTRRMFGRHRANIEVVDGAAERIPVDARSVDAVWAVNSMHHWVDVERAVAEIARVLRPDGRILLVDEVFTDPSHPEHRRFGTDQHHDRHGFTMIDADEMGRLLRAAGLTDVDASNRRIADRPAIGVTAKGAPTTGR